MEQRVRYLDCMYVAEWPRSLAFLVKFTKYNTFLKQEQLSRLWLRLEVRHLGVLTPLFV